MDDLDKIIVALEGIAAIGFYYLGFNKKGDISTIYTALGSIFGILAINDSRRR